jgi:VIT1/CCC1 family predicted Fe2+/Mn2+ transporter
MKRFGFAVLLAFVALIVTPKSWAYGDDDHHKTSAIEMSGLGLAAATLTGGVVYLVRRRRDGSGK